jgi:hypothetical protein
VFLEAGAKVQLLFLSGKKNLKFFRKINLSFSSLLLSAYQGTLRV